MDTFKKVFVGLILFVFLFLKPMNAMNEGLPFRELLVFKVSGDGVLHEFGANAVQTPPIRIAVVNNDLNALKKCISEGEKADEYRGTNYGETLLHCAATHGSLEIMEYLITVVHMDPNVRDRFGATPAHYAAGSMNRTNQILAVTLLKAHGANMRARDKEGSSITGDAMEEMMPEDIILGLLALGCPKN